MRRPPRYSIVVPTRERPQTLPHTLRTVLEQNHDSFEIVVADNASGPETRAVIERVADPRIHYLRSDNPIPMSENWGRALAACRGEWITFIGDDDGLMPNALRECDDLIATHSVRSIRAQYAVYVWPCASATGEANRLQFHTGRGVGVKGTRGSLDSMCARPSDAAIPLPYHGWIHRSLFADAAESGPVFQGSDPDTYAGILLATLTDEFLSRDRPLTVMGISGRSNIFQSCISGQGGETTRDNRRLERAAGMARHPLVPDIPTIPAVIIDGLLKVRDRRGDAAIRWSPSRLEIALHCAASIWRTDEAGLAQVDLLRSTLESATDIAKFDAALSANPPSGNPPRMAHAGLGLWGPYMVVDAQRLGVRSVDTAALAAAAALEASTLILPVDRTPNRASSGSRDHLPKRVERAVRHAVRRWWKGMMTPSFRSNATFC